MPRWPAIRCLRQRPSSAQGTLQRRLAYREMETYSQLDLQGDQVQKTRIGEKNLKWMDAPSGTVFGEIVDYACKNVPPASAA